MTARIVRLGSARGRGEGTRLGTVRRPPRGVRKQDFARKNWYDVWFPLLAPSAPLVAAALEAQDERQWAAFVRKYRAEMAKPAPKQALDVLAALSHQGNFSLGCYCENEERCHRSQLRALLLERGADVV